VQLEDAREQQRDDETNNPKRMFTSVVPYT
jgi:hypothetical protein